MKIKTEKPKEPATLTGERSNAAAPLVRPVLNEAPYDPADEEELHCECSNPAHQHR